jgi:DNA-binding MarR family transcriptional regulator
MSSAAETRTPVVTTEPKPRPHPALADRVGHLLAATHFAMHDRANEILEPFGIQIKQFAALVIADADGPISQQALGESIGCDRTTMVELMDDLERAGLTKRRRNPTDRRAYAIELTAAGRKVMARAGTGLRAAEKDFLEPLSDAEREKLRDMLLRLLAN